MTTEIYQLTYHLNNVKQALIDHLSGLTKSYTEYSTGLSIICNELLYPLNKGYANLPDFIIEHEIKRKRSVDNKVILYSSLLEEMVKETPGYDLQYQVRKKYSKELFDLANSTKTSGYTVG